MYSNQKGGGGEGAPLCLIIQNYLYILHKNMYIFARLPDVPICLFSALKLQKLQKSDFCDCIKANTLDALLLLKANVEHIDKLP